MNGSNDSSDASDSSRLPTPGGSDPATTLGASGELPALPEPFARGPKGPTMPAAASSGCGKVALLGCGFLVLLFGIGMVVFVIKANDALVWIFRKVETEVEKGLPADLSAADRARLRKAFAGLYDAVQEENVEPAALQRLQAKFMEMAPDIENGLTLEQVRELTISLEGVTGDAIEEPEVEEQNTAQPLSTADRRGSPRLTPALA